MKKILLLLIAFATLVIGLGSVNAETDQISKGTPVPGPYYYAHFKEVGDPYRYLFEDVNFLTRKSDGAFVYCVQPFVTINTNSTYNVTTEDMQDVANITYDNWKIIEKIAYYGYGFNENGVDHSADKWYPATQMLIWKYANPNIESYFTATIGGKRDDSILASEMNEIMDLVNRYLVRPSFGDVPSEIVVGDTISINDSKGVLSNYEVSDIKGGNVIKNSNTLNITPTEVGNLTFNLTRLGNRYGEPTRLYYAVDSQNVVRRGNIDPIKVPFKIRTVGGTITPKKYDADTFTETPQGEGTLLGAVYGIYKEDGTRVGSVTTGETSDYLPSLGRFYLLEEKPSKGYQLDKNKHYFDITLDNLNPQIQVLEQVISLDFDIIKVYADNKTGIMTPEVGIDFGIYNNVGEEVKRLTTDSQGTIKFKLPYGTYTVKQLTTTKGHEKAEDFTLEVKETGPVVTKVIANAEITAKLKVIKVDSETGDIIAKSGIKFKIYDTSKNEFVSQTITYPKAETISVFETDSNGILYTPYPLNSGTYILYEEDQVINGYVWNKNGVEFTIDDDANITYDNEYGALIEVRFKNKPVKGEVEIEKLGEELVADENGYHYEDIKLNGVVYELYAEEDIYSANGVKIYSADDLIGTYTTKDGYLKISNLYLGKYYLLEKSTVGNYAIDTEKHSFILEYKDQYTPIISIDLTFKNYLVKGNVEINKVGEEVVIKDNKYTYEEIKLDGVVYELYAEEDICSADGNVIYNANDLIGIYTTKDGYLKIADLYLGKYYLIEVATVDNHVVDTEKHSFTLEYVDEFTPTISLDFTFKNYLKKGTLEFTKTDVSTGEPLPNTKIQIFDADTDTLIFEGITDENGMITISDLYTGNFYILESEAPEGYSINPNKMEFQILENGEVIKATMTDELIVEVPNTEKNEFPIFELISLLTIGLGLGVVVYAKKNNKRK